MQLKKSLCLAPLALAVFTLSAQAQTAADSMFSFQGFGTVGLVGTNTNEADFVIPGQPRGATKSISGEVSSKLGLQVNAKINKMFSATAQLLTKQTGDGNFTPELEWGFAKAQLMPSLSVRLGRMGAPFFAVSDFRDVGYANTWLRPPQDVYGQVPLSHFDGADLNWQTGVGPATVNVQLYGGKSKSVFEHTDIDFTDLYGFNATAEFDNGLTLRVGHVETKLSVKSASLAQIVGLLRRTPFASVGNEIDATDKKGTFTGVGLSYDSGDLLAMVEFTKRKTDSYVPSTTGWYGTVGYRFGKFTPYVTLSELKQDSTNVNNIIPPGVAIPGVTADLRALINGTLESQSNRQKTTGLGVRWDAWRSIAVKAQYDRITPNGPGLFANPTPAFGRSAVNVYSVAVDFVF